MCELSVIAYVDQDYESFSDHIEELIFVLILMI